jgi:hypothetical protein
MVEMAISTRAIEHLLSIAQAAGIGCQHDDEEVIRDFVGLNGPKIGENVRFNIGLMLGGNMELV